MNSFLVVPLKFAVVFLTCSSGKGGSPFRCELARAILHETQGNISCLPYHSFMCLGRKALHKAVQRDARFGHVCSIYHIIGNPVVLRPICLSVVVVWKTIRFVLQPVTLRTEMSAM